MCLLAFIPATAATGQFGVADRHEITFNSPVRVGDTLLPVGNYLVVHTMDGDAHIMVFKQVGVRNPAEAKVKCHLVPLDTKAGDTRKIYLTNAANERVLSKLVFEGERAEHEF